jgi:hypothetical protein
VLEGWRFRDDVHAVLDHFASGNAEIVPLEIRAPSNATSTSGSSPSVAEKWILVASPACTIEGRDLASD